MSEKSSKKYLGIWEMLEALFAHDEMKILAKLREEHKAIIKRHHDENLSFRKIFREKDQIRRSR